MIIFLYGPDDYRRLQKKRWYIGEFEKKHSGLMIQSFDLLANGTTVHFGEFAGNQSIFQKAKLAILENAFELEAGKLAKLLPPLASDKGTTILMSERDKPVKALASLLEKPTTTQEFKNLEGVEWLDFIKTEAKKLGVKLADAAAQFLGTIYQGNSWALVTELQKLSAFGTATIEKKDLDVFDLEIAPNYWALINGMKSYDARTRLYALEKLLAANDPAPKLFNILAAQAGEKTPRMAEYDLAIKSGRMEYEEALLDLALS